jgi:HlyD family secretion protein
MGMDKQIEKKKWPPKKIAMIAASVLFVAFVIYIFVFGMSKSSLNVKAERLTVSDVSRGPFQEFIPVMGNVLPYYHYLTAVEGGTVEEIYLEAGTQVKKGDPILKLANTTLLINLMWRESELFQQINNLRNTRLDIERYRLDLNQRRALVENNLQQQKRVYERYQELIKDDLISQHEYELAKDQYEYLVKNKDLTIESQKKDIEFRERQVEALEGQVSRMNNNLEIIRSRLDNLTIKAPVSGYLTALDAEIGQTKQAGVDLGQIDTLEGYRIRAGIDEHYLARVEKEMENSNSREIVTISLSRRNIRMWWMEDSKSIWNLWMKHPMGSQLVKHIIYGLNWVIFPKPFSWREEDSLKRLGETGLMCWILLET